MELSNIDNLSFFFIIFLAVAGILTYFLKKHLFSIFDFWVFIILNQTIILSLFIYLFYSKAIDIKILSSVLLSATFLILGLNSFSKKKSSFTFKKEPLIERTIKPLTFVIIFIYVANTLVSIFFLGLPFITGVRRTISVYSQLGPGFGIIYYIDWGIKLLMTVLIAKLYILRKKKLSYLVLAIFVVGLVLNTGSRLVYLQLFLFFIFAMHLTNESINLRSLPKFVKIGFYALPIIILVSFTSAVSAGYEANVFLAFIKRFIGSAEGPFYYYIGDSRTYLENLSIVKYHFAHILPYFGIPTANEINLGVNITKLSSFSFGKEGFGPNPTFYVVGDILFGRFSFIYAYALGAILSIIRYRLNRIGFSLYFLLNISIISILVDGTLFTMSLFYVLMLLIPLSIIIIQGYKKENSID